MKTPETDLPRLVVLVSGGGSNLQAIIDATASGSLIARVAMVISNNIDAYALERASNAGIPTQVVDHNDYRSRAAFELALREEIEPHDPALIILAGFMRILSADFVARYAGRILNIHPSLLPAYTGLNTHQRAIDGGEAEHGATVHLVTAELDAGPIVRQARVPIMADDTASELATRVLEQEHRIYPEAIQDMLQTQKAASLGRSA